MMILCIGLSFTKGEKVKVEVIDPFENKLLRLVSVISSNY